MAQPCSLRASIVFPISPYSVDLGLGDLDGDGDLDAFVVNNSQPDATWFQHRGPLEFGGRHRHLCRRLIQENGARHEPDTTGPRLGDGPRFRIQRAGQRGCRR